MSTANLGYIKKIHIYLSAWYCVGSSIGYKLFSKEMKTEKQPCGYQSDCFSYKTDTRIQFLFENYFDRQLSTLIFCVYACMQTENTLLSEVMQWLTQQIILLRIPGKQPVQLV